MGEPAAGTPPTSCSPTSTGASVVYEDRGNGQFHEYRVDRDAKDRARGAAPAAVATAPTSTRTSCHRCSTCARRRAGVTYQRCPYPQDLPDGQQRQRVRDTCREGLRHRLAEGGPADRRDGLRQAAVGYRLAVLGASPPSSTWRATGGTARWSCCTMRECSVRRLPKDIHRLGRAPYLVRWRRTPTPPPPPTWRSPGAVQSAADVGSASRPSCRPWKAATVGKGNATKDEIQAWLDEHYPELFEAANGDENAVDAMCIGLYGIMRSTGEVGAPIPTRRRGSWEGQQWTRNRLRTRRRATCWSSVTTSASPSRCRRTVVTEAERAYRCHEMRIVGFSWDEIAEQEQYPSASPRPPTSSATSRRAGRWSSSAASARCSPSRWPGSTPCR